MYTLRVNYYIEDDKVSAMLWCIRADEGFDRALWDGTDFIATPDCASLAEVQEETERMVAKAGAEIVCRQRAAAQKPSDRDIEL